MKASICDHAMKGFFHKIKKMRKWFANALINNCINRKILDKSLSCTLSSFHIGKCINIVNSYCAALPCDAEMQQAQSIAIWFIFESKPKVKKIACKTDTWITNGWFGCFFFLGKTAARHPTVGYFLATAIVFRIEHTSIEMRAAILIQYELKCLHFKCRTDMQFKKRWTCYVNKLPWLMQWLNG